MKTTKQELYHDLHRVKSITQSLPTKTSYTKYGKYSKNTVTRRFKSWNNALKECFGETNREQKGTVNKTCSFCGKSITISKSAEKENNFCNRSCAATYNNQRMPKRKLTKKCKECKSLIRANRTYCDQCINQGKHLNGGPLKDKTLMEVIYHKGSNKYGVIRSHARSITKTRRQICEHCGYHKHVETCHIKDIGSFSVNTKLSVINAPSNLLILCPNCHWEFDHNLLKW